MYVQLYTTQHSRYILLVSKEEDVIIMRVSEISSSLIKFIMNSINIYVLIIIIRSVLVKLRTTRG
jgi:hypothetical protein